MIVLMLKATVKNTVPIILAAGKGNRMGTVKNKCLLVIYGKTLLEWTIDTLRNVGFSTIVIVTRTTDNQIEKLIKKKNIRDTVIVQDPFFMGAGHALFLGTLSINQETKYILTLYGDDSFLYTQNTLKKLLSSISNNRSAFQLTTVKKKIIGSIGGLKRNTENQPIGFYTQPELVDSKAEYAEIVCGCFLFDYNWLRHHFHKITKSQINGEFILTSLIKIAFNEGTPASVFEIENFDEWSGVNTVEELRLARKIKKIQNENR